MYIILYIVCVILSMIWFYNMNRKSFVDKPFGFVFSISASITFGVFIGPIYIGYLIVRSANKHWLKGL